MTLSYISILHTSMLLRLLTGRKTAYMTSKVVFCKKKFKLNPDKTEFILFDSRTVCAIFSVNILINLFSPAEAVRNLGIWFDLKLLRKYLMHEAALLAANPMVGSCLDYCNSLFRSLSALDLHRPQSVQNSLARIVANTSKYSHITTERKSLFHFGYQSSIILFSRWSHWCTSLYIKVVQNALNLSLNPDIVCTKLSQNKTKSDGILLEVPHFV